MWELIAANKRKSIFLFSLMGVCLLLLGFFIGSYYFAEGGWLIGISIAFAIWLTFSLISYFSGDKILLAMSKAKKVTPEIHPQLFNIVEEMKIAGSLPQIPDIYIIPDPAPNAFAVGRTPEKSAIAVTAGLLEILNRDELQGVIAHETSHIMNRDILFMTFSGVLLGSIVFISHFYLRTFWFTGGRRRSRNSIKGGGRMQVIIFLASITLAILTPILAQLLYFSISRKREYLADATAVRLTRYPEGLASALEKLSSSGVKLQRANKATAALYIINPLKGMGIDSSSLTSTHPPIDQRVSILRKISQGANYRHYQLAYAKIVGSSKKSSALIPRSGLKDSKKITLRKQASGEGPIIKTAKKKQRDLQDLIKAVNNYAFIACTCGLKIKIPPNFSKDRIRCPRCRKLHQVPFAQMAALGGLTTQLKKQDKTSKKPGKENIIKKVSGKYIYERNSKGWESFSCVCGSPKQLSPSFSKEYFHCCDCGRKIIIKT